MSSERLDDGTMQQPEHARTTSRSGCGLKGWVACGVLFFGGLVLLSIAALTLMPRRSTPPASGPQPGGPITGRVTPPEAARDVGVVHLMHGEGFGASSLLTTELEPDGSFRFAAPPLEGYYVVTAGADTWSLEREVVSLLTDAGEPRAAEPVELALRPACRLEVQVRRISRDDPLDGELRYRLNHSGGGLFGIFPSTSSGSRSLVNGIATLQSMSPGEGELTVTMDDGESRSRSFELTLDEPRVTVEFEF